MARAQPPPVAYLQRWPATRAASADACRLTPYPKILVKDGVALCRNRHGQIAQETANVVREFAIASLH